MTMRAVMCVPAMVVVSPVVMAVSPGLGGASNSEQSQQPHDEQQPDPHFTSTGRARDEAPGITAAASVESHCSSSEQ